MKPRPSKLIALNELPDRYQREVDADDARMEDTRMLRECRTCHNSYDRRRPRCPACGATTPSHELEGFNSPREARTARKVERRQERVKKISTHACVLCRKRAKKKSCPRCKKPCHPACLSVHKDLCQGAVA